MCYTFLMRWMQRWHYTLGGGHWGGGGEREWKVSVLTGCQYLAGRLVKFG